MWLLAGKVSYRSYWTQALLEELKKGEHLSVKALSMLTCIKPVSDLYSLVFSCILLCSLGLIVLDNSEPC